jgi:hypothetical protein
MVPLPRFTPLCNKQFAVGAEYTLQIVEPRNMRFHSWFFAQLHEMWDNLPEDIAKRWPTFEHLRAWSLVQAGSYTEKDYVCDSASKAKHLARIIRAHTEYAVIKVSGDVVKVFDPKSQSVAAMNSDEFKETAEKVLAVVAALNPGLSRASVAKEAAKVAPPEPKPKTAPAAAPAPLPANRPTTAPAYFAYARSWILGATDKEGAGWKWDSERDLRDQLRVSIPNRRELKGLLARQFEEAEAAR